MDKEYNSLLANETWELVDPPLHRSIISTKWLFRRKYHANGSIARFKARFVARGFSQQPSLDFYETFSPIIKMTSLRLLLAFATLYDYYIHQMDVTIAFLHGILREEIFISQPEGYVRPSEEHKVCRLLKSLYGLKQAPCVWYDLLDTFLLAQGFLKCATDPTVYFKCHQSFIILLGLYIDDLVLISNDLEYLSIHKALLSQRFSMTDNKEIAYILGIQIIRDRSKKTLQLIQSKYIKDILTKFNMSACNPVSTPLEAGIHYSRAQGDNLTQAEVTAMDSVPYKQVLGTLQYLVSCTRWDLAFPVNHLSQFMFNPAPVHWLGVKQILRYLKGTMHIGLFYSGTNFTASGSHILTGWCDADWAGDPDSRRSTSGYIFQLDSACIISWQSQKQSIVALSSAEAEYIAVATVVKELIWLQSIISELQYTL